VIAELAQYSQRVGSFAELPAFFNCVSTQRLGVATETRRKLKEIDEKLKLLPNPAGGAGQ